MWCHATNRQGLAILDGRLYETTGLYGQSTIRELDKQTGQVLRRASMPSNVFGEGLAVFPSGLGKALTWRSKVVYTYNLSTFARVAEQPIATSTTEGWGIAFDGDDCLVSDGSANIMRADPDTLARLGSVQVRESGTPVSNLNELEWVLGEVLANVWFQDYVVRIDPATGRVLGRLDMSSLPAPRSNGNNVLNGIACDPATFADDQGVQCFFTGKQWPTMHEIRLLTQPRQASG
jgi:glutamine cyclotransferase